jgi:hypothetical protein
MIAQWIALAFALCKTFVFGFRFPQSALSPQNKVHCQALVWTNTALRSRAPIYGGLLPSPPCVSPRIFIFHALLSIELSISIAATTTPFGGVIAEEFFEELARVAQVCLRRAPAHAQTLGDVSAGIALQPESGDRTQARRQRLHKLLRTQVADCYRFQMARTLWGRGHPSIEQAFASLLLSPVRAGVVMAQGAQEEDVRLGLFPGVVSGAPMVENRIQVTPSSASS